MAFGQRGRFVEAVEAFERAIEIKPDYAPAYHNLGLVWWTLGQLDRAAASYRKAIDIEPTNDEPHCGLARVLARQGEHDDALAVLHNAAACAPRSAKVQFNLGGALERSLEWDGAAVCYLRSIELNPLHIESYTRLARLSLFILDRPDEAVALLTTASGIDPDDERVRRALDEALELVVR
jgi:Flp pilus assembly protein TadD